MNLRSKLWNFTTEEIQQLYWEFSPTSKKVREEFLNLAKEKVGYYKPIMEDELEIDLGHIAVKDSRNYVKDHGRHSLIRDIKELREEKGRELSPFEKGLVASPVIASQILARPIIYSMDLFKTTNAQYFNSVIYFPFNYMNRFNDRNFYRRKKRLDMTIVHEMSHKAWHLLGGEEPKTLGIKEDKCWSKWNEGFAEYCARDNFKEFYPADLTYLDVGGKKSVYQRGLTTVWETINKHGPGTLLEIPSRWQEFEKEISSNPPR